MDETNSPRKSLEKSGDEAVRGVVYRTQPNNHFGGASSGLTPRRQHASSQRRRHSLSAQDGSAGDESPDISIDRLQPAPPPCSEPTEGRSLSVDSAQGSSPGTRERQLELVTGHLRALLQERNINISRLTDEVQQLKSTLRDASRDHETSMTSLRSEISSLECKMRMMHIENDSLRMKCRQADDGMRSEVVKHRESRAALAATEKELAALRQNSEARTRQADQTVRGLREKLAESRRLLSDCQHQLILTQQQQQQQQQDDPAAAVSSPKPSSSSPSLCAAAEVATAASSSPEPRNAAVAAQPRPHPSAVRSLQAQNRLRAFTAIAPIQRMQREASAPEKDKDGPNAQRSSSIASAATEVLLVESQKNAQFLRAEVDRLLEERRKAGETFSLAETLLRDKLEALEEELRQSSARENEWKLRLDDITEAYEEEVSVLAAQLSRWREDQVQQHASLQSARSRPHGISPHAGGGGAGGRAGPGVAADDAARPSTPTTSIGAPSVIGTPTVTFPRHNGAAAAYDSPDVSETPTSTVMLLAVGTETQLREHVRQLDRELCDTRERVMVLEESRRGLLGDIAHLQSELGRSTTPRTVEERVSVALGADAAAITGTPYDPQAGSTAHVRGHDDRRSVHSAGQQVNVQDEVSMLRQLHMGRWFDANGNSESPLAQTNTTLSPKNTRPPPPPVVNEGEKRSAVGGHGAFTPSTPAAPDGRADIDLCTEASHHDARRRRITLTVPDVLSPATIGVMLVGAVIGGTVVATIRSGNGRQR